MISFHLQGPVVAAAPDPVYELVQWPDDLDYKSKEEHADEIFNIIAKYWTVWLLNIILICVWE